MFISIVTINYNNNSGLEETIKSVITENNVDFEYLIIDGNSTDESVNTIKKYEKFITYWISEPDSGIYNAMNKGVQQAKGEWVLFMNSGDMLIAGSLQKVTNLDVTGYDIIYGQNYSYSKGITGKLVIKDWDWSLISFMEGCIPHQSTLTKRNLLLKFPFKEEYKLASCRIFFIETIVQNNIRYFYVPIPISIYDVDGQSTTQKNLLLFELKDYLRKYYGNLVYEDLSSFQEMKKVIQNRKLFDLLHYSSGRPKLKFLFDNLAMVILRFLNKID